MIKFTYVHISVHSFLCLLPKIKVSHIKWKQWHTVFLGFKITWRRKRQPTPVLLPGRSHGRRNLVRYSPRGHKELDTTEWLHFQNHCRWWLQPWNLKTLALWKKCYNQPRQHINKQRHYFANKGPSSQSSGFSSSHVWMLELDYKESWGPKNWYFLTVILEKTFESPLYS